MHLKQNALQEHFAGGTVAPLVEQLSLGSSDFGSNLTLGTIFEQFACHQPSLSLRCGLSPG